jgi:hypothetical protein
MRSSYPPKQIFEHELLDYEEILSQNRKVFIEITCENFSIMVSLGLHILLNLWFYKSRIYTRQVATKSSNENIRTRILCLCEYQQRELLE